ncbi:MAG: DUF2264 domain-containing protein [Clostridia bacterium]|nr:DUF2264 domain-containing protein [Clostridia bacterium]
MTNVLNSKNDYRSIVTDIMDFIKPYCSEGHSRIVMDKGNDNYNDIAARDFFLKMMWAAVPFIKGGGHDSNIEDLYRLGTINGTNPNSAEYWSIGSDIKHISNEMATVAYGLLMNSDIVMDLFTKNERQDIVNWLYNINFCSCDMNEEQFFIIFVNSALKLLGRPYDINKLNSAFDSVEKMYIGNGWYGLNGVKNYKTTLSIQFYSLIYAKTMEGYDEFRCRIYMKRAKELLAELYSNKILFHIERDIALTSFCSACIYADINVTNINIMSIIKRSMISHNEQVMDLFLRYHYCNDNSSYDINFSDFLTWFMKAFLTLTLPEEHKFWSAG